MLDRNEIEELNETAVGSEELASAPLATDVQPVLAGLALKTKLLTEIQKAGPFTEALQITLRPWRPKREVVSALKRYVLELSAAKQAEWNANPVVGAVVGYSITRRFLEVDSRDGITVRERVRSTLLLNPNLHGTRRHQWLNSVYLPYLSCDIDGNYYFRRKVCIALEVMKNPAEIALEINTAFADPSNLWALGEFKGQGFDAMWVKPSRSR